MGPEPVPRTALAGSCHCLHGDDQPWCSAWDIGGGNVRLRQPSRAIRGSLRYHELYQEHVRVWFDVLRQRLDCRAGRPRLLLCDRWHYNWLFPDDNTNVHFWQEGQELGIQVQGSRPSAEGAVNARVWIAVVDRCEEEVVLI